MKKQTKDKIAVSSENRIAFLEARIFALENCIKNLNDVIKRNNEEVDYWKRHAEMSDKATLMLLAKKIRPKTNYNC